MNNFISATMMAATLYATHGAVVAHARRGRPAGHAGSVRTGMNGGAS